MRFFGRVFRDGKFWLAEIPILSLMTQGRTKREAYAMAIDIIETLVDRPGFSVSLHKGKNGYFEISAKEVKYMVALLLRRRREDSGLTLAAVAARLGARSRNAYARYEQGLSVPTIEKLAELLSAISPERDLVLSFHNAAKTVV